jgi:hypothetical protein
MGCPDYGTAVDLRIDPEETLVYFYRLYQGGIGGKRDEDIPLKTALAVAAG